MLGFGELGVESMSKALNANGLQSCLSGPMGMTLGAPLCRMGARFGVVVSPGTGPPSCGPALWLP